MDWDALYAQLIAATGWTWDHIDQRVTLPQANALAAHWIATPPPGLELRRIARYLGLPDPRPVHTSAPPSAPDDALRQAQAAGLPVMEGRPDDPMLDLIGL